MKYVCIDDGAVSELISGREYQSIDFEGGDRLINALSGSVKFMLRLNNIMITQDSEGAFVTTAGAWKAKKYLVIDCEHSALFTQLRSSESLTSFQKLLRFCTRYWSDSLYTRAEKFISGTTKTVIFPLPYSDKARFRIAVEREPLKERLKKRGMDGRFLLVYKSGHQGADSSTEIADEANFRRVFDRLDRIYRDAEHNIQLTKDSSHGSQIASTELDLCPASTRPLHMPFTRWQPLLTEKQRQFIFADPKVPHRLIGPAGTGKTLSIIMRSIKVLQSADQKSEACNALIITHSEATKEAIESALTVIDPTNYQARSKSDHITTLSVETLASLCAKFLNQSISESEFIDRDASDSKILQQLYIEQALTKSIELDLPSFKPYLSEGFRTQLKELSMTELSLLFQHEVSVLIKGRAGDSFDIYKNCPSLKYGLQVSNDADKGFAFDVFKKYQTQLEVSSQFDTDDVVISAIGQLDTPIWRRRRLREGYDFIGVDESHLFNINELHIFHHFTREAGKYPISFTVDQAQAVGDRGWDDTSSTSVFFEADSNITENTTKFSAVFRSSPQITDFSHSILSSGATLFTNFQNTLTGSQSTFTPDEERISQPVRYLDFPDDTIMVENAFKIAEDLQKSTNSTRAQVLVTSHSDDLIKNLHEFSIINNKPVSVLERRGDFIQLKQAEQSGHIVLSHVDFVGGLEFNVVIIVGVDKGRVPHEGESNNFNSRSFAAYSAHNRLYVASSRARFALNIIGIKSRGPSDLLRGAFKNELIERLEG